MARTILVPIDGSDPAWKALDFALAHHPDATLEVLYVIDITAAVDQSPMGSMPVFEEELYETQEEHASDVLEEAQQRAAEYDREVETEHLHGLPRDTILEYAAEHDVDQIVIGSHGRSGIERVLIGSVAEKIARHSPVPVTIVRAGSERAETDQTAE